MKLSTLGQPHPEAAWKQEVARRIAAHKNRKGASAPEEPAQAHNFGSSLAAQAASRVAARFAQAPSYTEMQAEEARLAVRAAEIATKVALEAQAAAEEALAEMHAAAAEQKRGPAVVESIASARVEAVEEIAVSVAEPEMVSVPEPVWMSEAVAEVVSEPFATVPVQTAESAPESVITQHVVDGRSFGIRWESDAAVRVLQPRHAPAPEPFEIDREDWWTPAEVSATLRNEPIAIESDAGTANLIAFPREIIATRKMRPRLAEPVTAAATERQLSIFEVDPGTVSTEPEPVADPWPAQEWAPAGWNSATVSETAHWPVEQVSGPKWSGMELDAHPVVERRTEPEAVRAKQEVHLASLGYRLMAMAVDGGLILAGFFAVAIMLSSSVQPLSPRSAEVFAVLGLAFAGLAYNALFLGLGVSTPGMRYAGIALSTFEDEVPTRAQLRRRLGAMVLSLAPVALGLVWSVFDEDHLSWHDRFSETYLRKR
ncbi:RDD family protein [Occallatibacter riparius]|uniref:RDD family protein n=1 Tax=Occallatibacter riparius TaxID=1002689 RepID=A0A9J7BTL3_9BACT|nr:RDD family protein [Occallatibacter riparius]UWZ86235.1 RDD family protein [Occallatibacter riparius]